MVSGHYRGIDPLKIVVIHWRLTLKVNGIIADITAGQFNEAENSIIIDEHGSWHNKFFYILNAYTPSIDFENYVDEFDQPTIENDYLMIVQQIHQNSTTL
ncbi:MULTISPECIES: hypothetical protein [Acinetobacter]|uniref:hypothetical protein n=1 Tax=Acinetobacter TaxID=469 RepID=UPI001D184901|nr:MULTISPECIES: hypothetical protein [Acinetobacter]